MALYIGLMSGTSVNGVDAVLAEFEPAVKIIARHEQPLPASLKTELLALTRPGDNEIDRAARLDNAVARLFADAVHGLLAAADTDLSAADIAAIGSHGQTIRHAPLPQQHDGSDLDAECYTVQLGNPSLLAELTGITVVADFRRRDMAAGGQGAPLAPAFHAAFFPATGTSQVVVNIGGIANLTLLPAGRDQSVIGFDTGPGNALLDEWINRRLGQPYDHNGEWAASGQVQPELLARWLDDPYFALPAPKSTGREYFHLDWLGELGHGNGNINARDIQATLLELTAVSIARSVRTLLPGAGKLWVCGGGAHNDALMNALRRQLAPLTVASSAVAGIDPDYVEALGFAWLARQTLQGLPGNLPAVTGAAGPRILGGIYPV